MGALEDYTDKDLETPDDLKSIPLKWNMYNVAANNQMFGYFTPSESQKSDGFDADEITLNKQKTSVHAWLKRAASKVTVAIDGSQLNEGVKVWIKSIQIKDIPSICWLGKDNSAAKALIEQGEKIVVSEAENGDGDEADNLVTKTLTYPRNIDEAHSPTAQALYFYENLQGTGQRKSQVWPDQGDNPSSPKFPDGNNPHNAGYKDGKIAGSYVEVVGFYQNNEGSGYIIYRFMLGKNITDNYDAQRNYHFKLTLKLKNNANENDWHIVYNLEPAIIGLDPCYISYLYNQSMDYSFNVVGGKLISLTAEIPDNDITKASWHPMEGQVKPEDGDVYWKDPVYDSGPWNGFLSLRKTTETRYGTIAEGYGSSNGATYQLNKKVFYGSSPAIAGTAPQDLSSREYVKDGTPVETNGDFSITQSAPDAWDIKIPLFTRPLVMVAQTGYSGNNPYVAYNRMSQVIFTAIIQKPDGSKVTVDKPVNVIQARRVVNPKAVWRKANSTRPFHVQLKIRESQSSKSFTNLLSNGPWRAVVSCGDWIKLMPTSGVSKLNPDGSISDLGITYIQPTDNQTADNVSTETNRTIDFSFKPSGTTSTPRGGIITIYYNNYSCVHTIFVRQGYEPVQFYGTGPMWHTGNLLTSGDENTDAVEVDNPQIEGSYFRQYNRLYPIDASSNYATDPLVKNRSSDYFTIAGSDEKRLWSNITPSPKPTKWGNFKVNGNTCILPSESDWMSIIGNPNTIYGYGILYGDEADGTKESISEANGADSKNKAFGMRGVIVCDESSGTQIFLPIAASGYGRFKQKCTSGAWEWDAPLRLPQNYAGVVQYANRHAPFPSSGSWNVSYKPLFWDLYASQGTLYWLANDYVLDINYMTLDFSIQSASDAGVVWTTRPDPSGSDAIHIRLVHDKP